METEWLFYPAALLTPVLSGVALYGSARFLNSLSLVVRSLSLVVSNLLVLTLLLSVLFLPVETYYHFFSDSSDSLGLTKETTRWFSKHYKKNHLGFRDEAEYSLRRLAGTPRLTFLGDSFTAGHGIAKIRDRFSDRVRRGLGTRWEVQNLADVGLDTQDELDLMAEMLNRGYETNEVVLVYCLNDILAQSPQWEDASNQIYRHFKDQGFWLSHSFFLNTLYFRWVASHEPAVTQYYDFVLSAYDGAPLEQQKMRMRKLRDLLRSKGISLSAVTFPFLHALGPRYAFQGVHGKLDQIWKGLEVPHLDLLPVFEARPAETLVVNPYDAHPNELANALASEAILKFLAEKQRAGAMSFTPSPSVEPRENLATSETTP